MMDCTISFKRDSNCHKHRGRLRNMSQRIAHVPILYVIVKCSKLKPMKHIIEVLGLIVNFIFDNVEKLVYGLFSK